MYGLVNRAIEELVREQFGDAAWEAIKQKANVDIDVFIGLEAYPDSVTYSLVGAASEVLNLPAETILEEFGKYWVLYTGKTAYGSCWTPLNCHFLTAFATLIICIAVSASPCHTSTLPLSNALMKRRRQSTYTTTPREQDLPQW